MPNNDKIDKSDKTLFFIGKTLKRLVNFKTLKIHQRSQAGAPFFI
jgi:hypothetical protein